MLTMADLEKCTYIHISHGNMGYTEELRHKGYSNSYRFVEHPRLGFIDRSYTLDDGGWERKWTVDDTEYAKVEEAFAALLKPPVITKVEADALMTISEEFVAANDVRDMISGEKNESHIIHWDTPTGRASSILGRLNSRALIEYRERERAWPMLRRVPGKPYTVEG